MANNEYVNRVDFGDETLIDISDTTAEPEDVIEGQVFYTKSGAPATGTLGDATTTTHGLMSATDKVKLDEIDSKKAPIIIDSKSGNPIVVNDGIPGLKIYDMKVSFTPKQAGSGDPSPDNIRPITGWEGVNIRQVGKSLVLFASQMGPQNSYYNGYSTWLTNGPWEILDQSIKYIYSVYIDNRNASEDSCAKIWFFNADGTTSAGFAEGTKVSAGAEGWSVVTCGNNTDRYFAAFGLGLQPGGIATKGMVEIGETRTDYVEYTNETVSVSWQSEAGTVYGGELDVLTGILTVTHAYAELIAVGKNGNSTYFYTTTGELRIPSIKATSEGLVCDRLKRSMNVTEQENVPSVAIYANGIIRWRDADEYMSMTVTEYNTAVANDKVKVAYEIKEPYTVQLSPMQIALLVGTNVFWSDTDNLEIAYPTDTKKYIDAGARDVQINGTSILQNGVANIPKASSSTLGAVKPGGMGVNVNTSGQLYIAQATDTLLKGGSDQFSPVTPYNQHTSAYYALAKLAGVDLANETVTVGQYPESAKIAIQKMLGIYDPPWELIRSDSFTNAESADYEVTVDQYGEPFELMEVVVQVVIPKDANTKITHYGAILFHYGDGSSAYRSVLMNNFTGPKSTPWYGSGGRIKLGNAISYIVAPYSESGNNRVLAIRNQQDFVLLDPVNPRAIKKITFRSVQGQLDYTIYGKRKQNY